MKIQIYHIFFIGLVRLKKVLEIIPYFDSTPCVYIYIYIYIYVYQPLGSGRIWQKVNFLKQSLTGLNLEFSFS